MSLPSPSGTAEAVRIQQLARIERRSVPGIWLPQDIYTRQQLTVAFETGLPLSAGATYVWRLEIDGQHRKDWYAGSTCQGRPLPPSSVGR